MTTSPCNEQTNGVRRFSNSTEGSYKYFSLLVLKNMLCPCGLHNYKIRRVLACLHELREDRARCSVMSSITVLSVRSATNCIQVAIWWTISPSFSFPHGDDGEDGRSTAFSAKTRKVETACSREASETRDDVVRDAPQSFSNT